MSKYVFATANHHDKGVSILNCFQTIEWQTFEARQIHKFEGGGHQSAPFSSVVVNVALRLGSNVEKRANN